jgi:hypothetical protein
MAAKLKNRGDVTDGNIHQDDTKETRIDVEDDASPAPGL